jgi:hypothetical protein
MATHSACHPHCPESVSRVLTCRDRCWRNDLDSSHLSRHGGWVLTQVHVPRSCILRSWALLHEETRFAGGDEARDDAKMQPRDQPYTFRFASQIPYTGRVQLMVRRGLHSSSCLTRLPRGSVCSWSSRTRPRVENESRPSQQAPCTLRGWDGFPPSRLRRPRT